MTSSETQLLAACEVLLPILKAAQSNQDLPVTVRCAVVDAQVGLLKLDVELMRIKLAEMEASP